MSDEKSIVHIGYHKTATTWFQDRFYPAVECHRYIPKAEVQAALINHHSFAFDPRQARIQLELDQGLPAILCEEELSGHFETGGLMGALSKEIGHRIHDVLPQAQIVMFVRHQVEMIGAVYAQYVKGGGTLGPREFLFPAHYRKGPWRQPYKKPLFAFEHFRLSCTFCGSRDRAVARHGAAPARPRGRDCA